MADSPHLPDDLVAALGTDVAEAWDTDVVAGDPLAFDGYTDAIESARESTGRSEAVVAGRLHLDDAECVVIAVDFQFLGGSMGVAAGERIARAFDRAREASLPVLTFLSSGGARMQEGMVSLVQMPKAIVAADRHAGAGLAQFTICRHPTTGGMYASFASRADLLVAEPHATIGFAGPRVAEASLGRSLRPGSHTAETAHDAGQVDHIAELGDAIALASRLFEALEREPTESGAAPRVAPETGLDAWAIVEAARHPERPSGAQLVDALLADFVPIHGDRATGDDETIVAGIGRLHGRPVGVIAKDRHAGSWTPTGYRIAQRLTSVAARLGLPIVTLIDTPGADPSESSERSGVARAIADTFSALLEARVPTIGVCVGEGGSGGALALGCCDRLLMQETSIFSVIAPEGAAAILERDPNAAPAITADLKLTAPDLVDLGIVDAVVPDDPELLGGSLVAELDTLAALDEQERLERRYDRWRSAGNAFLV